MWSSIPLVLAQSEGEGPVAPPPGAGDAIEGADGSAQNGNGTGGAGGTGQGQPGAGGGSPFGGLMPLFLMLIVIMFVFMMGGNRKEKKRRAAMLDALKKGDKVQTIGGVLGTVVEVRESEVIVKVDENANTRMRFARSAIQNVLADKAEKEKE